MAKYFFEYKTVPYLYDAKRLKLFRLENRRRIEISDLKILRNIRLNSTEIEREQAFVLARGNA